MVQYIEVMMAQQASQPTLDEMREILHRPFVFKLLPHVTPEIIKAFLDDVVATSRRVHYVPARFAFVHDLKDEPPPPQRTRTGPRQPSQTTLDAAHV